MPLSLTRVLRRLIEVEDEIELLKHWIGEWPTQTRAETEEIVAAIARLDIASDEITRARLTLEKHQR